MPSLFTLALLMTLFSMAFPPLIIVAVVLWFFVFRIGRRRVCTVQAQRVAKLERRVQSNYDKAVRYFS